jgi:hypothetical protein
MVGIIEEFCQQPTQITPQTSLPWCAVCPSYSALCSIDSYNLMHGRPIKWVGWGRLSWVQSQLIK